MPLLFSILFYLCLFLLTKNLPLVAAETTSPSGNIIVHLDQGLKSWHNADAYCEATYNTHLATITNEADNAFLDGFAQSIWIGLNDDMIESNNDKTKWEWASGATVDTSTAFWNSGEPNGGTTENCVANEADVGRRWADQSCENQYHYFACDAPNKITVPTRKPTAYPTTRSPVSSIVTSPSGNLIARLDIGEKNWADAEAYCVATYNTHLATIKSVEDNAFLDSLGITAWTGLNDREVESNNDPSKWVWASGVTFTTSVTFWNPGEPNGGTSESCIANEADGDRHWADHSCNWNHYVVCDLPPTASPTKKPTQSPTPPTRNPTRSPSAAFFDSQGPSLPFGVVKAFDLYLLIDTTKNYELINNYCQQYKLMSGASPSSCFDLMMDYAIEIVKSISVATNGYYSNDLSNGLRVQASLIQCVGSSKTPSFTTLFTLTGDSSIIMNGLNNARTNTQLTESASCPIQGLYDVIQKVERGWDDVGSRPYRAVITLTDAIVTDGGGSVGNALIDVVSGIRYRCTPSIVIVPFRMTDTSSNALNQQLSLKILTGNIDSSIFEAKNAPWIVIPKIGEQITTLLRLNHDKRCALSTSFSTADKYWCGYYTIAACSARASCLWSTFASPGCFNSVAQSACSTRSPGICTSNSQCQWVSSTCTRKSEEPDCNSLVLQTSCNIKSSFCSWNESACITKSTG